MTRCVRLGVALAACLFYTGVVWAQTLIAVDDAYGVGYAGPLVVEGPGVLDNDTYNGGPATGAGATVELIGSPSFGTLECDSDPVAYDLCPDGSFSYTPDASFSGFDRFTYEAAVGGVTDQATVVLSACTGGPTQYACWQESAYLAKLGELGYSTFNEGFEADAVWGVTRFPLTEPSVLSQGIRWRTNHPDPPASNELTTGSGPAHTGLWAVYDPEHGYATGTPQECDIDNPPDHCLLKDGLTGAREGGGSTLVGVGGYFKGSLQPNLVMILDGGAPIGLGVVASGAGQYFGVIDTAGFTSFRFEETDGKVGQERYVFADDFTLGTALADSTPPRVVLVNTVDDTGDGVLAAGEATDAYISELLVYYSEPVRDLEGDGDPDDVTNPANYLLINDGGNGFQTVNCAGGVAAGDVEVPVDGVIYTSGSVLEAALSINGGLGLPLGSYRLLVCGTTSIRDWAGNALDGNGNGTGGDDFRRNFSIIPAINNPPVANPQSVTTPEDTPRAITLTGSDPDGDPLMYSIVAGPSNGTLTGTPPSVTFTPASNYNGADSFSFWAFDGLAYSAPATVTITVTAVNDRPVANPQAVTTPEDTALAITLTGSDPEGSPLTYTIVTAPSNGALSGAPPNVTYTPAANYNGADSFTFRVRDGSLNSPPAAVSITVGPPAIVYFSTAGITAIPGVASPYDNSDIYTWDGTTFGRFFDATVAGLPGNANVDGLVYVSDNEFYLSFGADGVAVPGIGTVQEEDVVVNNGGVWSVYFDGTASGLTVAGQDIDAFDIVGSTLYFSTVANAAIPGVAAPFDDADIYSWNGASFARVFDGSVAGLPGNADIDALNLVDETRFCVSFLAGAGTVVAGLGSVQDEDIVCYNSGAWTLYLDASAAGVSSADNLDAISIVDLAPNAYFSTAGNTNPPGVGGTADDADIYSWDGTAFSRVVDVTSLGVPAGPGANVDGLDFVDATHFKLSFNADGVILPVLGAVQEEDIVSYDAGVWSVYFDGTAPGLTALGQDIDAFEIVGSVVYFSTAGNTNPPGVGGTADEADIYSWDGTTFSRVVDVTTLGLPGGANVDGLVFVDATDFNLSFNADGVIVPGVGAVQDEDIINYSNGVWSLVIDGTGLGLTASGQDLDAIDFRY